MPYRAPVSDHLFLLKNLVDYEKITSDPKFEDAAGDVTQAILREAAKLSEDVIAPLQREGDLHPAHLENGIVRTSPGYAEGFRAIAEGGWTGITTHPDYGGMGLPMSVSMAVNDYLSGACLSLQLNPLLTQGHIEALEHHASDEIKALYLPKLASGEWNGTMNLTEPQAGSDLAALRARAEPNGDGTYAVSGQKIFITWGDSDFMENTSHLVLARLPDAPEGVKGISLFIVPKYLPKDDGTPGEPNDLRVVSLEHKLGIHGSPTCVMEFSGAKGWLVGEENKGLMAMFTMMNNARLGVGVQGIGVAEAAYQKALEYAQDRKQGPSPMGGIIGHADVRRMLGEMRAHIFAARAIAMRCAEAIDRATISGDPAWQARAAFLTPIAKSYGTEVGVLVAEMGVQIHGGMGFIEETGAAQYARDVRITPIYEGTNGIQAIDLVGRKLSDKGAAAFALLDDIESFAESCRAKFPNMSERLWNATETLREATESLVSRDLGRRLPGADAFLHAFALVLGAHAHMRAAAAGGDTELKIARIYLRCILPHMEAYLDSALNGGDAIMALDIDDLSASFA